MRSLPVLLVLVFFGACQPVDDVRARHQLRNGNLAYLRGEYESAVRSYERVLRLAPQHAQAQLNTGYSLMAMLRSATDSVDRQRLADRALESLSRVASLDPQDGLPDRDELHQYMLTLLLDSGQRERAIELLEERVATREDVSSIQMISDLYLEAGAIQQALVWRERCVAVAPERFESHYSLGVFAWRISHFGLSTHAEDSHRAVDRGLAALDAALELKPDYAEALAYKNLLYREKARYVVSERERRRLTQLADELQAQAQSLFDREKP